MIPLSIPQGSLDWITERLWRLTASDLKKNITSTGALSTSEAALESIDAMIAGIEAANVIRENPSVLDGKDDYEVQKWLCQYTGKKFSGNIFTRRGNDLEPDALAAVQQRIGESIQDVGICIMGTDRNGVVSCSPDGLIISGGRVVAGAETKAPVLSTWYGYVAKGELPVEYKLQVHGSMAMCEVDVWHFGAYFPGKPLFYQCVRRDKFTDSLARALAKFRDQYAERLYTITEKLRTMENQQEGGVL